MYTNKINIGGIEINNRVFLAPMAGVTDSIFRRLCKEQGCGLVYSEMISAKGILYENKNTALLLSVCDAERPAAVQLFGSDPHILSEITKKIEHYPADIIDINMGCPAPKIVKNGEGSALMQKPELVSEIIGEVVKSTKKPVTIKIRKGFDGQNVNAAEIAKIAEQNGAAAITVHGRTREQYYSGLADLNIIAEVKNSVSIPVIGNGDIKDAASAENMFRQTGCDAIMIGRAAMGNPWIFKAVNHYLETGEILPAVSENTKIDLCIRHLTELAELKGEYIAVREMRKHIGWYIKGRPHSAMLRTEINKIEQMEQLKQKLQSMYS